MLQRARSRLVAAGLTSLIGSAAVGACSGREPGDDPSGAPVREIVCLADSDCPAAESCSLFLDECLPNCKDASRSCLAPLECSFDQGVAEYFCRDLRPPPACAGTPVGQAVAFLPASDTQPDSSPVVHWVIADGCVPVTYESSLASQRDALAEAVAAWNAIDCARLCLDGPFESNDLPDFLRGERGIHVLPVFHPNTLPQIEGGAGAITTNTFTVSTGRMLGASIEVAPALSLPTGAYVALLGFAVGLKRPSGPVDSALAAGSESLLTMPTALDREAYCVLYGDPPYCE